jgi:sigma-B regulation protein RsbU (phosphoserine phosphatase)
MLRYTNAGHCAPMLTTGDAQVMQLEEGGPPVGMFAQSRYQEQQIQLDPGSLLFTFTDGIPRR